MVLDFNVSIQYAMIIESFSIENTVSLYFWQTFLTVFHNYMILHRVYNGKSPN